MHDLKQIAKDAERVEASAKAWLSECEGLDRDEIEYHEAERRLAAFARDMTDETPLTVERLVERGYVHDAIRWPGRPDVPCLRRGRLYVYSHEHADPRNWTWEHDDAGPSIWPVPRTLGELAMLLAMMEGR